MRSDDNGRNLTEEEFDSLITFLQKVPDYRHARGIRYRLHDLLLMCIYAVLAGCSDAASIQYYVELNQDYFKDRLGLDHTPSHDTFSRVMRLTDFSTLGDSLEEWLQQAFPKIYELYGGRKVLHVDGKATRGASEKSHGEKPIYQLNVMYEGESIGVKTAKVGDKTNEAGCLPDFLNGFDLKNTIVTIDAMGCNQNVIDAIHGKSGYFVLPVKENQPRLYACIMGRVKELEDSGAFSALSRTEVLTKEHGRTERNTLTLINDTSFVYEALGMESFFGSVAKVGILDRKVTFEKDGQEVTETTRSLLITDLEDITSDDLMKIKKAHWNIEMQHWLLDIQLREDRQTARKDNAVINGGILRRFCLMVRKHDTELSNKPMNRFLMANAHSIERIEKLLFGQLPGNQTD